MSSLSAPSGKLLSETADSPVASSVRVRALSTRSCQASSP
jgi:hypothetical protein